VITQSVKITTRCEACGGVLIRDIGQFIQQGRLWWGTEGTCQACPAAWCEQDSGAVTPEEIRQALLTEHGSARLRLTDPKASTVTVLRALRELHGLSLSQARTMADELSTNGLTGTLVETELLADRLRHLSVGVTIETSVH
jgi:ribosomal protein L7/L12